MSQPFAHDSILGGLNLLKRIESRNLLKPGERPPYPIMIFRPTVRETTYNMNRADLGVILFYTLIGKNHIIIEMFFSLNFFFS